MDKKPDYKRLYDRTQGRMDILIEVSEATISTLEGTIQAIEKSAKEMRLLLDRIKQVQQRDIERYDIEDSEYN